ncbi:MAG: hypothetical protein U9Q73_01750 [Nanoarchaeota archaeon]|nr:hypothetical protein [Nanoarchaeota archaeon]
MKKEVLDQIRDGIKHNRTIILTYPLDNLEIKIQAIKVKKEYKICVKTSHLTEGFSDNYITDTKGALTNIEGYSFPSVLTIGGVKIQNPEQIKTEKEQLREYKQKNKVINMETCSFCKQSKEKGTELFWCPRIIGQDDSKHATIHYFGNWVCLECCSKSYFKSMYDKHQGNSWCGSCARCDFPLGASLKADKLYQKPTRGLFVRKCTIINRDENLHAKIEETGEFMFRELSPFAQRYFGFKWDHHRKKLILIGRPILDGVSELVFRHNKLPTRIIITLRDTFTYDSVSWGELRKYYWSACKYPQHFKEEKWMDSSPVIILSGYLNKDGINFNQNFMNHIEYLKQKFGVVL